MDLKTAIHTRRSVRKYKSTPGDKGLGTCWLTGPLKARADQIAAFLEVPQDRELVAIVALGYPDHTPPMPPKRDVAQKTRWLGFD